MKKILIGLSLVASTLIANNLNTNSSNSLFLPYIGYINYSSNSDKNMGVFEGIYLSNTEKNNYNVEFGANNILIKYKDKSSLKQQDYILNYTFDFPQYNITLGGHYISSTDKLTDKGKIGNIGLFYKHGYIKTGFNAYYSLYPYFEYPDYKLTLMQISPMFKEIYFGDYFSDFGSIGIGGHIDYIKPIKNKQTYNLNNQYTSIQIDITNQSNYRNTIFGLSGWIGKRVYAIENNGFIVNNTGEEQNYGINANMIYNLNKGESFKIDIGYTRFSNTSTSITTNLNYILSF